MYWSSSCSPISSPASSPSPYVDSSPPSSPSIQSPELDSSPTQDPFAASTKATKLPRLYEKKKRAISPEPTFQNVKKSRYNFYASLQSSDVQVPTDMWGLNSMSLEADHTKEHFDDVLNEIYNNSCGQIDLSSKGLTHIPFRFLEELKYFVALPARSELDYTDLKFASRNSASGVENHRFFGHTKSSASESDFKRTRSLAISSSAPREEIHLLLSINQIKHLPYPLFDLERLTVLSLRGNKLTHIPPEISRLKSLKTLNIANNELKFLPSEMLGLTLSILHIHPNPFIPEPSDPSSSGRALSRSKTSKSQSLFDKPKKVSPIVAPLPPVIPLSELCFRHLFSSPNNSSIGEKTLLSSLYDLPIDEKGYSHPFPPSVRHYLHVGHPNCLANYSGDEDVAYPDPTFVTGIGVCPSPRHDADEKKPIFFRHTEERYTWESNIAGVSSLGGVAPIRWRGCQSGCLNFLDPKDPGKNQSGSVTSVHSSSLEAISAAEDAEIVQPVQVTLGAFTVDEFGD